MFDDVDQIVLGFDRYLEGHQSKDDRIDLFGLVFGADSQERWHDNAVDDGVDQIEQVKVVVSTGQIGEKEKIKHKTGRAGYENPVQTEYDADEVVVLDVLAAQSVEMFQH